MVAAVLRSGRRAWLWSSSRRPAVPIRWGRPGRVERSGRGVGCWDGAEAVRRRAVVVVPVGGPEPGVDRSAGDRGRSLLRTPGEPRCAGRRAGSVAPLGEREEPGNPHSVGSVPAGERTAVRRGLPLRPTRYEFRSDHIRRRPRAEARWWTVPPGGPPPRARPCPDERRVRGWRRALSRRRRSAGVCPRDPVQPHQATLPAGGTGVSPWCPLRGGNSEVAAGRRLAARRT